MAPLISPPTDASRAQKQGLMTGRSPEIGIYRGARKNILFRRRSDFYMNTNRML